ncbi:CoA-binding protein [Chitinivorax sp. B]|uniref:CoA-binding protein n=1 Tax=Chitinivorax sp. B TaxID=2502235 RepID=UPI0010F67146|nr:CoA-binding protein [Chitinivorax sp. B]
MQFTNPDDLAIRDFLQRIRRIAVLGLSPNQHRPSYHVSAHMQRFGYDIVPVRPGVASVLGQPAYAHLQDVPGRVELVNVFRNANELDTIVENCISLGMPAIWIQQGIINEAAACRARDAGLFVVMDRCIYIDYLHLCL